MIESSGDVLLEACVENLDQALLAERKNADRIELCGRLDLGGITPPREMIISSVKQLSIPTKIMIRPRGGNFIYSDPEVELMISDIIFCKKNGIGEIVLGALTDKGEVDLPLISSLSSLADPMKVTFHKAIDDVNDYMRSLEELSTLKTIESVLTSGTRKNAILGKPLLKNAIEIFSDTLSIIAAGSITNENIEKVHAELGAKEYHGKRIVGDLIS
jgi:copper homeostasis protein